YAGAGHPPALLFPEPGRAAVKLGPSGIMIGVDPDLTYATQDVKVSPGSRLYLFSDGTFEIHRAGRRGVHDMLMVDGLANVLAEASAREGSRVEHALRAIQSFQGSPHFTDDFSLLEVEFAE